MSAVPSTKPILRVLSGEPVWPLPVWLMRQAGRYLPEYRELRAEAGSFLALCYDPRRAAEVTLQPIRRFGFDAAILFSDILVVPHALGQDVRFLEGEGPRLDPVTSLADLGRLAETLPLERLAPVFETLDRVKGALPAGTTLLGFCGAPWTVASYMIAGKGTPDQAPARLLAYRDPGFMLSLVDRLAAASVAYLTAQIDAGAEAVQIFESFGAALPPALFGPLSLDPIRQIVQGLKARTAAGQGDRVRPRRRARTSLASSRRALPTRSRSTGRSSRTCSCRRFRRGSRRRATSIRWRSSPAAIRSGTASTRSCAPPAAARTSSTSATASCRKRRSRMSRR